LVGFLDIKPEVFFEITSGDHTAVLLLTFIMWYMRAAMVMVMMYEHAAQPLRN
jgi:hypothetical protein